MTTATKIPQEISERESSIRIRELLRRARGGAVLVIGGGVTGTAVSTLLAQAEYRVSLVDEGGLSEASSLAMRELGVGVTENFNCAIGSLPEKGRFQFCVLSPGVSLHSPIATLVRRQEIPLVSEIDLAVAYLGMPKVAVTGTNGKTTTVSLIREMLVSSGIAAESVGNIGRPLVSLIDPSLLHRPEHAHEYAESPLLVCEVSSYQLESAVDFTPQIGVWLNIDDDHLERHGSLEQYLATKGRIFSGQSAESDWSLVWADDPRASAMMKFARGRYFPFGILTPEREGLKDGCFIDDGTGTIVLKMDGLNEHYSLKDCRLIGKHNRINLSAAVAASRLAGATVLGIRQAIASFHPLPHRVELVGERRGVLFINDSKGTNVSAACAALETVRDEYPKSKVVLLLGGQKKEGSFRPLLEQMSNSIRHLVCFGGSADLIREELIAESSARRLPLAVKLPTITRERTLGDAVATAFRVAQSGDVVLLSPACSSFDAYRNYVERGEDFRRRVLEL